MASFLRQLRLFLWKNYLETKSGIVTSVLEAVLPALFSVLLLVMVRPIAPIDVHVNSTTWESFPVDKLPLTLNAPECDDTVVPSAKFNLAYAPNNTVMKDLINDVLRRLGANVKKGRTYLGRHDQCRHIEQDLSIV